MGSRRSSSGRSLGVNASIRIVNQQTVSEEKLLNSGSATAEMLHFLTACIRYGVSVCIAGSTGSGKTTIMAWLLSNVPNNRRLITIEEGSREFDLVKRDAQGNILNSVVHLLTRPSENPALNINQDFLLERVLRKHPDVIGVGEMRSAAESLSAAESSRTGHTVCTTIHSNSCNSTYRRMMTLAKRKYNMDDSILMQIMVREKLLSLPDTRETVGHGWYWENWLFATDVENTAEEAVDSAEWLNSQFHILAVRYTHKPTGFVFTNYRFRDKRAEAKSSGHDLLLYDWKDQ